MNFDARHKVWKTERRVILVVGAGEPPDQGFDDIFKRVGWHAADGVVPALVASSGAAAGRRSTGSVA